MEQIIKNITINSDNEIFFLSYADLDSFIIKESLKDEKIIIELNGKSPEFIMSLKNDKKNTFRLCNAVRIKGEDKASFIKRDYSSMQIDEEKYNKYYKEVILPLHERSNNLLRKKFPSIAH